MRQGRHPSIPTNVTVQVELICVKLVLVVALADLVVSAMVSDELLVADSLVLEARDWLVEDSDKLVVDVAVALEVVCVMLDVVPLRLVEDLV